MPVSVQWDNPQKTIIYARYEHWTWEDFYQALHDCGKLSATVNHSIYIICDLVDNLIPKGGTITHAAATVKRNNEQVKLIVVVSSNRFIQALNEMSTRAIPGMQKKYRMVNTVEAARELITKDIQQRALNQP